MFGCLLVTRWPARSGIGWPARRRGEQQPEGSGVDDLALWQRHLNQLPIRRAPALAGVSQPDVRSHRLSPSIRRPDGD